MALQLGALRDALVEAGASEQRAREAAEEAAGYEDRLRGIDTRMGALESRMTALEARITVVEGRLASLAARLNMTMAVTIAVLGSQLALWLKLADLSAAIARLH